MRTVWYDLSVRRMGKPDAELSLESTEVGVDIPFGEWGGEMNVGLPFGMKRDEGPVPQLERQETEVRSCPRWPVMKLSQYSPVI